MATTEMNLEDALESALSAWILDSTTHGITIGMPVRHEEQDSSDILTAPCVILKATREEEDPPLSGCWRLKVEVKMLVQADDTANATLTANWHNLMSILIRDDLASQLSSKVTNFRAYAVRYTGGTERDEQERHWLNRMDFQAWAIAAD